MPVISNGHTRIWNDVKMTMTVIPREVAMTRAAVHILVQALLAIEVILLSIKHLVHRPTLVP